jgi:co-chaperonin GroES (HSP10)
MQYKPVRDLVLCRKEVEESAIILDNPETDFVVVAVGPDVHDVKEGDKVFFRQFHEEDVDEEHVTIQEKYILATYE